MLLGVRASLCRMEKMETKQTLHQEKMVKESSREVISEGREVSEKTVAR